MHWLAPIWLTGLIPWAGLVLWMLMGVRQRVNVPFLPLWKGVADTSRARRRLHRPPLGVAAVLLGIGLLLIAAAGPSMTLGQRSARVTLIVDRGLTMSATNAQGTRYQLLALRLAKRYPNLHADIVSVPPWTGSASSPADWLNTIQSMPPTAMDTRSTLPQVVANTTSTSAAPIIVLSDQPLTDHPPQVWQIAPDAPTQNIAIAHIGARIAPSGAVRVLVVLRNDSPLTHTRLSIQSKTVTHHDIVLPPSGQTRDYIFALEDPGPTIQASIDPGGEIALDDTAWLVRRGDWPVIIADDQDLPPALARMVRVYTRLRLPGPDSLHVHVTQADRARADQSPEVLLAPIDRPVPVHHDSQSFNVLIRPHPTTDQIDFARFLADARTTTQPPPSGFTPIVSLDGTPVVAMREDGARSVWIGFSSESFDRDLSSVIFWSQVFEWLGGGPPAYSAEPVHQLDRSYRRTIPSPSPDSAEPGLLPGIWTDQHGQTLALNAPQVPVPSPVGSSSDLDVNWPVLDRQRATALSPWLVVSAVACLLIAALTWARRTGP